MQKIRDRLIILHQTPHITRKMIRRLKDLDPTLQNIFTATPSEISTLLHIPVKKSISIYRSVHHHTFQPKVNLQHKHIQVITQIDDLYPEQLRTIPDAPFVLYLIGDISLLRQQPMLSVIGTRNPSNEAFQKLSQIITPLIEKQWVIVSGLAYGIDGLAHQLTLDYHGKTIAVLGGGFHHIYPKKHTSLGRSIAKHGLLISEYPPDVQPRKYHFPERNRIISGLSQGTLVVEAAERSGTMITVEQALEQGREVYAVPGSPLLEQTIGCNRLIQDGAKLTLDATDIIEEWPMYQL